MQGYTHVFACLLPGSEKAVAENTRVWGALGERLSVIQRAMLPSYGEAKGTFTCIIDKPGRSKVTRPAVIATVPCSTS